VLVAAPVLAGSIGDRKDAVVNLANWELAMAVASNVLLLDELRKLILVLGTRSPAKRRGISTGRSESVS